jgi:thymidylate synthase
MWWLRTAGIEETTRNGLALVSPEPVMTIYERPWERVLFDAERNCNPFFHLAEAVWMLAGRNDVKFLSNYNKQMAAYSDDSHTLRGAYGFRWARYFEIDQINTTISILKDNPTSRQAVIAMWDPTGDLGARSKDIPCNTHIYFRNHNGKLEMTVMCRSNDMVWGGYGANAVHFSFLHEYISRAVGLYQGRMYQFSNNAHIYQQHWPLMRKTGSEVLPYPAPVIPLVDLYETTDEFRSDCVSITKSSYIRSNLRTHFAREVLHPMLAREGIADMPTCDWKMAAQAWLERKAATTGEHDERK